MNYFTSKTSEYCFYLLELDGKVRMDKLRITRFMFSNKASSEKWYNDILAELKKEDNETTQRAINKLNELYSQMK